MAAKAATKKVACTRCGTTADRKVAVGTSKFAHRPDAPRPQNTGASSVDHDEDIVIGRDSHLRLAEMQKRQDVKRNIIDSSGLPGDYLSRLPDGDYFVMTEEERVAAKKARIVNQDVMKRVQPIIRERILRAREDEAAS